MAEDEVCEICFTEFDNSATKYACGNLNCDTKLCGDCIDALISFSKNSNLIPTCPNKSCNELYILRDIKGMTLNIINNYEEACLNYFIKENGDSVQKRINENEIIEKIRNERLIFIEKAFPKAINLVANLVFKDKMKKLDKQKRSIINKKLSDSQRACLSSICNGFLDNDFICMKCGLNFCKKCEKKINTNHECRQEDLDSINLINNMTHCPGCKLPVFKNEGCDSITCANCNTNFLYSSGKAGGHGSSNQKININISKPENLSTQFEKVIPSDCLPLILEIENKRPTFKSKDILLIPIKNYMLKHEKNKCAKDLAKKLEEYVISKRKNIKYHNFLNEIGDLLMNKNFDNLKSKLEKINIEIS